MLVRLLHLFLLILEREREREREGGGGGREGGRGRDVPSVKMYLQYATLKLFAKNDIAV